MTAARRHLPPPSGADALGEAMRRRYQSQQQAQEDRTTRTSDMDRRSWYMPKESAEALAAMVDDIHFATRKPKYEILAAVVAEALARRSAIERRLR